jgi:hypothetical protein
LHGKDICGIRERRGQRSCANQRTFFASPRLGILFAQLACWENMSVLELRRACVGGLRFLCRSMAAELSRTDGGGCVKGRTHLKVAKSTEAGFAFDGCSRWKRLLARGISVLFASGKRVN